MDPPSNINLPSTIPYLRSSGIFQDISSLGGLCAVRQNFWPWMCNWAIPRGSLLWVGTLNTCTGYWWSADGKFTHISCWIGGKESVSVLNLFNMWFWSAFTQLLLPLLLQEDMVIYKLFTLFLIWELSTYINFTSTLNWNGLFIWLMISRIVH